MRSVDKSSCSCAGCLFIMIGIAGFIFISVFRLILAEYPIEYRGTTGTSTGRVTHIKRSIELPSPLILVFQSCEVTTLFTTSEGKEIIFTDEGMSSCKYVTGQDVPVTYMLDNPSDAQVSLPDWTAVIMIPLAVMVILLLFLLPLVGVLVKVIREMDLPDLFSSRSKAR